VAIKMATVSTYLSVIFVITSQDVVFTNEEITDSVDESTVISETLDDANDAKKLHDVN